jgi:tRNA(Arg) A34 adenosine deaminase TadA
MPSKRIIESVIKACQNSDCEHKMAACLYKGGSILRITNNQDKTMQYRKKYFPHSTPTRHAEMNCIHGVPRDVISECSMLVIRISKNNQLKSAKPCFACVNAIYDSGIRKVYYSSYSGEIVKLDFDELLQGIYTKEIFKNF